jgi:hypothetical protein
VGLAVPADIAGDDDVRGMSDAYPFAVVSCP